MKRLESVCQFNLPILGLLLLTSGVGRAESATAVKIPTLVLHGPVHITQSTRIAPGTYKIAVSKGQAVIEVDADNVQLHLEGVALESGETKPWKRIGYGIRSLGHSHVAIFGGRVSGYRFNIDCEGTAEAASDVKIVGSDVSGSRGQRLLSTPTHFDVRDWVDIFDLNAWQSYGAGLYLKNVDGAWIQDVAAHAGQNGIMLVDTTHTTIEDSDLSRNSGWGIALYGSSWNNVLRNHADWNVRCEGSTYSAGCDSAGILLMAASNRNQILGNSFTHSGDGFFLSKSQTGPPSEYNNVAFNDGSYSPHNAFEAVFTTGDLFLHNVADHSNYGFWLSFSSNTTVMDNEIELSKEDGIAAEHAERDVIAKNRILTSGKAGISLFNSPTASDPSRDYSILQNRISGNPVGILLDQTHDSVIAINTFDHDAMGIVLQHDSSGIGVEANIFTGGTPATGDFMPLWQREIPVD